jgi:hypothetical protein
MSPPSSTHRSASFLRNKLPPLPKDETKPPASAGILTERNNARLQVANEGDQNTMSKYLSLSLTSFLIAPVVGPDDSFIPKTNLVEAIRKVATTPAPVPKAPPIRFSTTPEALNHNAQLLQDNHYSMASLISPNHETTLAYGFRIPTSTTTQVNSRRPPSLPTTPNDPARRNGLLILLNPYGIRTSKGT